LAQVIGAVYGHSRHACAHKNGAEEHNKSSLLWKVIRPPEVDAHIFQSSRRPSQGAKPPRRRAAWWTLAASSALLSGDQGPTTSLCRKSLHNKIGCRWQSTPDRLPACLLRPALARRASAALCEAKMSRIDEIQEWPRVITARLEQWPATARRIANSRWAIDLRRTGVEGRTRGPNSVHKELQPRNTAAW